MKKILMQKNADKDAQQINVKSVVEILKAAGKHVDIKLNVWYYLGRFVSNNTFLEVDNFKLRTESAH